MKESTQKITKVRKIVAYVLLAICAVFTLYFAAVMFYRVATVVDVKRWPAIRRFFAEFGFMCLLSLPALDIGFGIFSWMKKKTTKIAGIVTRILICTICTLFIALASTVAITGAITDTQTVDNVCVLGLSIDTDELPVDLVHRLNRAVEYREEHEGITFITTGGNSEDPYYSEAAQMERYLIGKGFSEDEVIAETNAKTTVENFKYTSEIVDKEQPLGVITNNYHIFRASKIAKKQGYTSIVRIPAPAEPLFYCENVMWDSICSFFQTLAGKLEY